MYFPVHGTGDATGDQSFSGNGNGRDDAHDITLTGSVPGVEGLNVGAGYAVLNYEGLPVTTADDSQHEGTVYATYAYGPLTVGYQVGALSLKGKGNAAYKNEYYGISYAVSDDLSLSYNRTESQKINAGYIAGQSTYDSISLSYSMGGMTLNISDADCSHCSYTRNRSEDETTVSLAVAF
jgi:hypothetical protein